MSSGRVILEPGIVPASEQFAESYFIPFLTASQNFDGGWGYHPDSQSSVEATCWALMALGSDGYTDPGEATVRGLQWLCRAQLPDGSWPAFVGQHQGCWTTALACMALRGQSECSEGVDRGHRWLLNTWPAEAKMWWRLRQWFFARKSVVGQNGFLRGWSWAPGTASWVEPTSYALIALRSMPDRCLDDGIAKRRRRRIQFGKRLLYDRMCLGGGWNSGNPLVYGVAGEPRVGPTAWALMALKDHPERPEIQSSLDWIERAYPDIRGPASLALAHLCLTTYGRAVAPLGQALRNFYLKNQFLQNVLVVAWSALALRGDKPAVRAA